MILYAIQAHTNLLQIVSQIQLLNAPGQAFLINVDPAAADQIPSLENALKTQTDAAYVIRKGLPVSWGGASQIYSWIDVFSAAAKFPLPWKYLINLSGECLPLVSGKTIAQHLEAQSEKG